MTQRADRTDVEEGFDLTARHGSLAFRALTAGASASTQGVAHLEYRGLAISEFTPPVHEVLDGWVTERKRVHLLVDASRLESYETPHSDPEAFRHVCDGLTRPRAKSA